MAKNAAPNYVGYEDLRVPFAWNRAFTAGMAQTVTRAQTTPDQYMNNAPIINAQTYWAAGMVQQVQGFGKYSKSRR